MKRLITSIVLAFLTLLASFSYQYGYIAANYSCKTFTNQCEDEGGKSASGTLTLGHLIIDAAGFFLQSNSDYQAFLKKIELSDIYGLNYTELQTLINDSIENIEMANSIYYQVWQMSKEFDYDPTILESLIQFDYYGFMAEKNLNFGIFQKVANLLKIGNVRGVYEWLYDATSKILEKLKALKSYVEKGTFPEIQKCWRLNQIYLESELFGQYVSEVFFKI